MKAIRLAVAVAAFCLAAAPFAYAGQVAGKPHAMVLHGQSGTHSQAGQHGKAAQPHGKAGTASQKTTQSGKDIAANIARNPQLKTRLEAMLPSGMTLEQAASGFRNQGQCIAALETSKNMNIPFADLKAQMTGDNHLSLGQAVEKLKPAATTGAGGDTEKPEAPEAPDTDKD